ncbi:MAG: universal stress protein, partial [bacterium]
MYKRLLVAVDGSAKAEAILPYALGISRATGSQLTLVHV